MLQKLFNFEKIFPFDFLNFKVKGFYDKGIEPLESDTSKAFFFRLKVKTVAERKILHMVLVRGRVLIVCLTFSIVTGDTEKAKEVGNELSKVSNQIKNADSGASGLVYAETDSKQLHTTQADQLLANVSQAAAATKMDLQTCESLRVYPKTLLQVVQSVYYRVSH